MKKVLLIIAIAFCSTAIAQNDKGNWFIGASSSSFEFNSNTGSDRTIDVSFTGFKDTLVADTDSLNLGFLFPYTYELEQDQNSEIDLNLRSGYFVADNFLIGLGLGYASQNTIFKTKNDPLVNNAALSDSLMNVWFSGLPDVQYLGSSYSTHYYELYRLLSASSNNDLTIKSSMLKIAPFVRYYIPIGQSAVFIDAAYEMGSGKEEIKDDANFLTTTMENSHSKINFGLGYELKVSDVFVVEPQFNYYMLNTASKVQEDASHPLLFTDMGEQTTERTSTNSGMNFSIGLSFYL